MLVDLNRFTIRCRIVLLEALSVYLVIECWRLARLKRGGARTAWLGLQAPQLSSADFALSSASSRGSGSPVTPPRTDHERGISVTSGTRAVVALLDRAPALSPFRETVFEPSSRLSCGEQHAHGLIGKNAVGAAAVGDDFSSSR